MQRVGSRAQVMHGKAKKTKGGLTKRQLKYNKQGKIVSRKASNAAKKSKNLIKAGYITKKGQFGAIKVSKKGGGGDGKSIEMKTKKISSSRLSNNTKEWKNLEIYQNK